MKKFNLDKPNILNTKELPVNKAPIPGESGGDYKDDEKILKQRNTFIKDTDVYEEDENSIVNALSDKLEGKQEEIPEDAPESTTMEEEAYQAFQDSLNQKYESDPIELNPENKGHMTSAHASAEKVEVLRDAKIDTARENALKVAEKYESHEENPEVVKKGIYRPQIDTEYGRPAHGAKFEARHTYRPDNKAHPHQKRKRMFRDRIREFFNKPL